MRMAAREKAVRQAVTMALGAETLNDLGRWAGISDHTFSERVFELLVANRVASQDEMSWRSPSGKRAYKARLEKIATTCEKLETMLSEFAFLRNPFGGENLEEYFDRYRVSDAPGPISSFSQTFLPDLPALQIAIADHQSRISGQTSRGKPKYPYQEIAEYCVGFWLNERFDEGFTELTDLIPNTSNNGLRFCCRLIELSLPDLAANPERVNALFYEVMSRRRAPLEKEIVSRSHSAEDAALHSSNWIYLVAPERPRFTFSGTSRDCFRRDAREIHAENSTPFKPNK